MPKHRMPQPTALHDNAACIVCQWHLHTMKNPASPDAGGAGPCGTKAMSERCLEFLQSANVLAEDVKLKIHDRPDLDGVEIRVCHRVGYDCDCELIG